ncbi:hypothetical protein ESCO_000637 [Escovopsis weberi]|uniref:DNase1 protein n=1 Tax=Escovopsis weberi TaxID=150374 RepID=A0A0M8N216_ESCWE|nr:hypothetical protein ESCO_000637 [Escovopsis weberi]
MRFFSAAVAILASVGLAAANTVSFWTLDNTPRTVYFTPNTPSMGSIDPVRCTNGAQTQVTFPPGWTGNFYAIPDGQANEPGMLGEVNFNGWNGLTYFDVSGIVKADDTNNVQQMWPVGQVKPMSGCNPFPCNNAYWHPDDLQTKVTSATDLMCTLGKGSPGINFPDAQ